MTFNWWTGTIQRIPIVFNTNFEQNQKPPLKTVTSEPILNFTSVRYSN